MSKEGESINKWGSLHWGPCERPCMYGVKLKVAGERERERVCRRSCNVRMQL